MRIIRGEILPDVVRDIGGCMCCMQHPEEGNDVVIK